MKHHSKLHNKLVLTYYRTRCDRRHALVCVIIHCFKITQKTLVFDVSDKQGHCSGTCAHSVLAGQQEGAHKTASEYLQSASAKMMLGFLPPSSRVTLFRLLFPAASWISLPTCGGSRGCISSFTCWDLHCQALLNLPISGKLSLINPAGKHFQPHTHPSTSLQANWNRSAT